MAIIVEDGSIVAGANSFVSVTAYVSFALLRGIVTANPEQELIKSMDYLNTRPYKGSKVSATQPLPFPRLNLIIDGFLVPHDSIHKDLIKAQLMTAIEISNGNDSLAAVGRAVISEKLGPMETTFQGGSTVKLPAISAYLNKFISGGSNKIALSVFR